MGGEPLLHPSVSEFCIVARQAFPSAETDIQLVTNGILLTSVPDKFWKVCAANRISIDLTQYPVNLDIDKVLQTARDFNVTLRLRKMTDFLKFRRNEAGDSDPEKAFHECRSRFYCPFLENGKIYLCCLPALSHLLQSRFGSDFPTCSEDYLNIHDNDLSGSDINDFINKPAPFCRYCATGIPTSFKWDTSKGAADEWLD
jgi:hypothetical protein